MYQLYFKLAACWLSSVEGRRCVGMANGNIGLTVALFAPILHDSDPIPNPNAGDVLTRVCL